MKKHRLIRLTKDRGCVITRMFLPKDTTVYADYIVAGVWHITLGKDNNIYISVIENEDFIFVE
jgi:hypothetical protein